MNRSTPWIIVSEGRPQFGVRRLSHAVRSVRMCCTPFLALYLFPTAIPFAQAATSEQNEVLLKNIEGTLCIKARLRTASAEVPAHVVLDLGMRGPMLVHERTAALLGFDRQAPVDLVFDDGDFSLTGLSSVARALEPLEELTRQHATALQDLPAVAVLGMPAFDGMRVELDVGAGTLRVRRAARSEGHAAPPAGGTTLALTPKAYGYWLDAEGPAGEKLVVRFATSDYDTRINHVLAERLGHPGGEVPRVMLGDIDLTRYAALRPTDMHEMPEPRPDLVIGTGLLSSFQVVLEPDRQRLTLKAIREPQSVSQERALFVALGKADVAAILAFLEKQPESRLAPEAAEALVSCRLEENPPNLEAIREAINWRARTVRPEKRAQALVRLADEFIALEEKRKDAYDLALMALNAGKESASADPDDAAVHQINARLGLVALLREDYTQARRYLLSAIFALPKDPYVNLWLGRLYEKTDQSPRAWSRYLESALAERPPIGAVQGLNRLNADPEFRRSFSMLDAENLLEGRVPAFAQARRYGDDGTGGTPARLVELFSNVEEPLTQAAEMAFDGLRDYLEGANTVFVQYHVGGALLSDAAESRAGFYGVTSAPAAFFDGAGPVTDGGEDRTAARVYGVYSGRAIPRSDRPAGPTVRAGADFDGALHVRLEIAGNQTLESAAAAHAVLCERVVMAVGPNKQVMHRNVARALLSPPAGWKVASSVSPAAFEVQVPAAEIVQRLETRLDALKAKDPAHYVMRPTWIDWRLCDVIVILQNPDTRQVLCAHVLPVSTKAAASG